jgi:single-stranded DNA-binding protein
MDMSRIVLSGTIKDEPCLSHELYGEHFFQGSIAVPRLSGTVDELPFITPGKFVEALQPGAQVSVEGQVRSYRRALAGGARLQLMVFVRKTGPPIGEGVNEVEVFGTLLRDPSVRKTPLGREIADLLVTVERMHGKKDCLPCIAWGRHAHTCATFVAGQRIHLLGRLQNREYQKELPDGTIENRMTYEVSVGSIYEDEETPGIE